MSTMQVDGNWRAQELASLFIDGRIDISPSKARRRGLTQSNGTTTLTLALTTRSPSGFQMLVFMEVLNQLEVRRARLLSEATTTSLIGPKGQQRKQEPARLRDVKWTLVSAEDSALTPEQRQGEIADILAVIAMRVATRRTAEQGN